MTAATHHITIAIAVVSFTVWAPVSLDECCFGTGVAGFVARRFGCKWSWWRRLLLGNRSAVGKGGGAAEASLVDAKEVVEVSVAPGGFAESAIASDHGIRRKRHCKRFRKPVCESLGSNIRFLVLLHCINVSQPTKKRFLRGRVRKRSVIKKKSQAPPPPWVSSRTRLRSKYRHIPSRRAP